MKKTSFLALLGKIFPEKLSGLSVKGGGYPPFPLRFFWKKSAKVFLKASLRLSLVSNIQVDLNSIGVSGSEHEIRRNFEEEQSSKPRKLEQRGGRFVVFLPMHRFKFYVSVANF